jgi:hypothetical protein
VIIDGRVKELETWKRYNEANVPNPTLHHPTLGTLYLFMTEDIETENVVC